MGGLGADTLTGGAGADAFAYGALADSTLALIGRDLILAFSGVGGEGDRIDLSAIDAKAGTDANDAFTFIGADNFHAGVSGELRVVAGGAGFVVSGDVNGDQIADFAIEIASLAALQAGDFVL